VRRHHTRRPKEEWLLSEAAPFIRRILKKRATDADRAAVALELADWLEARGDKMGYVQWFRHPKLRWEKHPYGISWNVHPWHNNGHGCGCRIDSFWWVANYPTRKYIESRDAEVITAAWLNNGVALEEYPWTREVAARIHRLGEYDRKVKDRAETRERNRKWAAEQLAAKWKKYAELPREFADLYRELGAGRFEGGGGI